MTENIHGVSIAVFRGGRVLLVKRAKPPFMDLWSLPGGRMELGESAENAVRRELREETGLAVATTVFVCDFRPVEPDGIRIGVFAARWLSGEPVAGSDAAEVGWHDQERLENLAATPGLAEIIARARQSLDTET